MCYDFFGRQLLLFTCLEGKSFYSQVQHQVQQATGASGASHIMQRRQTTV